MDPLSTANLTRMIVRHGSYHQQDLIVGRKVDELSEKGFPFKTEEGLDFCKLYTFDHEVSRLPMYKKKLTLYLSAFVRFLNQYSPGLALVAIKPWAMTPVACSASSGGNKPEHWHCWRIEELFQALKTRSENFLHGDILQDEEITLPRAITCNDQQLKIAINYEIEIEVIKSLHKKANGNSKIVIIMIFIPTLFSKWEICRIN